MSKHLLDIALENGFKVVKGKHMNWCTMDDSITTVYENDKGQQIEFGAHDANCVPTLIYPAFTKTEYDTYRGITGYFTTRLRDAEMTRYLDETPHEVVFQEILDKLDSIKRIG